MNVIQWISTIFHGRFMALSWHFPLKTPKSLKSTISYSSHIHVAFMPFSWRFHGTFNQTEPQTVSCHFRGTFPENYSKMVIFGYIMFVCVSICRQCFFSSFDIFSLMVFQVDQSFFVFSLIKI